MIHLKESTIGHQCVADMDLKVLKQNLLALTEKKSEEGRDVHGE